MSENLTDSQEQAIAPAQAQTSAGMLLRQAREAAGLHVAALAVAMKVPVKKLEALEADRMDLLPDAVFVRALASSMCRTLKIDAAPILERMPSSAVPRLDAELRGINAPFKTPGPVPITLPAFLTRPAVLIVLALLLAAVGVLFFPVPMTGGPVPVSTSVPALAPTGASPEATPVATPASPSASASASASTPAAVADSTAPVTLSGVTATPTPAVQQPAMTQSAVPVATPAILSFKARGTSWVEVTDAQGTVQLRKTLFAGDEASAGGAAPLSVVVGRADLTQLEVRGKAFDMLSLAKDNVARFEVK
jgi:cytoskeleton protein RodZ